VLEAARRIIMKKLVSVAIGILVFVKVTLKDNQVVLQ
jgi:hypothetical protein